MSPAPVGALEARLVHPELNPLQPPVGTDAPAAWLASVGAADGVDLAVQIRKPGDIIALGDPDRRDALERKEDSNQSSHSS